jgi:hypothetical protein
MAAVAAGHKSRAEQHHELTGANYYSIALRQLNACLSDPVVARSDATLGACLLLCVYEVSLHMPQLIVDRCADDLCVNRFVIQRAPSG